MDLSHLNPSQRSAVECTEGPLLVLAGAGSGKTRVITTRIVHLLELGIPAENIVALSFTNKAADEMRHRLRHMVGAASEELVLSTFHSLGVRMLRADAKAFGLPKRFVILDQGDVFGVMRSLLREHGYHGAGQDRRFDVAAIVQRISLWKNEFLDPDEAQKTAKKCGGDYDEVAADIYASYLERLDALGAVDFDDLVCRVAKGLDQDEFLRARWVSRFRYLMVDEYQDTNTAQFQMLRQLLGPEQNLCVVGDDDQAIYGWRGAKVANILGFDMYFREARVVKLEENYRSRPPIIHAANQVIGHNKGRHDKKLKPTRPEGEDVRVVVVERGEEEARWVGDKVRKLMVDEGVPGRAVAVLYRSARQARLVEERLQEHGIPYRVLGGQAFYDKKEVKDVLAYLKCIVTPHDDLAVRRALDTPPRGIGARTVAELGRYAESKNMRLIDAVHRSHEIPGLASRPAKALDHFSKQIRATQARTREQKSVVGPLKQLIDSVHLRSHVHKEIGSSEAADARWQGVEWLYGSIDRFESRAKTDGKGRWGEYLGNLALSRNQDDDDGQDKNKKARTGKVTLATLHSAKGLEWSCVFMLGCEEGTMPHRRVAEARKNDAVEGDLEEERRLFYVGMTRARDRLWLCRSEHRVDRGRELEVKPSRFVLELPETGVYHYIVRREEVLTDDTMQSMADAFLAKLGAE